MKNMKSLMWSLLTAVVVMLNVPAQAQDDLYYDPATDGSYNQPVNEENYREDSKVTRQYRDDDEYYEDEYAYEYSSRIRRFHRPVQVIDYYDPFFVDMWFYDPFYMPGATIYIGNSWANDYWRWRRWNRWNRWNSWAFYDPYGGYGFNSWGWGWNRPWGWGGGWNNPYVYNNYYYDPYWTWNGYNPYYCPGNAWVNNNYYWNNTGGNTGGGYTPRTYTGVRRTGTTVNPGYARLASNNTTQPNRLSASNNAPVIEMSRPNGRAVSNGGGKAPDGSVNDRSGARPTTAPGSGRTGSETRRPVDNGRTTKPESANPGREVTPNREVRPSREVTPDRETPPSRREVTPSREERPSRREMTPSRERSYDRSSDDRPARRSEPAARPSRSGGESRGYEPSRSSSPSSGSMRSGNSNSGSRSGSSNSSGSGGRSSSSSSSKSGGGKGGRN